MKCATGKHCRSNEFNVSKSGEHSKVSKMNKEKYQRDRIRNHRIQRDLKQTPLSRAIKDRNSDMLLERKPKTNDHTGGGGKAGSSEPGEGTEPATVRCSSSFTKNSSPSRLYGK